MGSGEKTAKQRGAFLPTPYSPLPTPHFFEPFPRHSRMFTTDNAPAEAQNPQESLSAGRCQNWGPRMVATLLIISFLLLFAALTTYTLRRLYPHTTDTLRQLPPPPAAGLFANPEHQRALAEEAAQHAEAARRQEIIARAAQGDMSALSEARELNDAVFYQATLNATLDCVDAAEVAQFLAENEELPANARLLDDLLAVWQNHPTRRNIAHLLHLSARTGAAEVFQHTLETVRAAELPNLLAEDLARLAESSYWLLPQTARSSGAGR